MVHTKIIVSIFAILIMIVLFLLVILHIYWAHGGNWPGANRQDLVDKVYGRGKHFPSIFVCYFVAAALIMAGVIPILSTRVVSLHDLSGFSWLNYLAASIFFLRGFVGLLPILERRCTVNDP